MLTYAHPYTQTWDEMGILPPTETSLAGRQLEMAQAMKPSPFRHAAISPRQAFHLLARWRMCLG